MIFVLLALVLACAVFVGTDAYLLEVKHGGFGGGLIDMGPVEWFFAVLLLWVIAFPLYLAYRPVYQGGFDIASDQARKNRKAAPSTPV